MMNPTDKFYIQSVNRALSLVDAVAKGGSGGVTLTELVRPDLPMSTAYRIMQNLVAWHYVVMHEDGRYALGSQLILLGELAQQGTDVALAARDFMQELSGTSGQTVYLAVLATNIEEIYYIGKTRAAGAIQLSAEVGTHNHIHSTANGKVLVSSMSNARIFEILTRIGMPQLTEKTFTDPEEYIRDLEMVRNLGYAIDDEENEKNVVCVAAPIRDRAGQIVASVSLSGIKHVTLTPDLQKEKVMVLDTAAKISHRLSYK